MLKKSNVDRLNPSTWKKFKPSRCKNCTAGCCTLSVRVDSEDLYHMGLIEIHQVNGPLRRIAQRLKKLGLVRSFSEKTGTFLLQQKNGTDCIFLTEERLCSIYDRRPSVCRRFPFNSLRPGYCPAEKKMALQRCE